MQFSLLARSSFAFLLLSLGSCKERRPEPLSESADATPAMREVGAEESKDNTGDEELRRLASEKAESDQKLSDLQKTLQEIESKMKSDTMMSEAERAEYQKQLDAAQKAKDELEAKKKTLDEEAKKAAAARKRFAIYFDKADPAKDDCLQLEGNAAAEGSLLRVFPCSYGDAQQFYLEYKNDTEFRMISKLSNKCLIVAGASKATDAAIVQASCGSVAGGESFRFLQKGGGDSLIQNVNSQLCMKILSDGRVRQNNCQTSSSPFRISLFENP